MLSHGVIEVEAGSELEWMLVAVQIEALHSAAAWRREKRVGQWADVREVECDGIWVGGRGVEVYEVGSEHEEWMRNFG